MDKARETLVERRPTNEILAAHLPELLSPEEKLIWLLGDLMNAAENFFGYENPKRLGHINSSAIRILDEIVDPLRADLTRLNAKVKEDRVAYEVEIERLKNLLGDPEGVIAHADSITAALEAQVSDLSARLARAVEVMRPFTCVVDLPDGHVQWTPPSLPAFQAARAFLSEQENPHG